MVTGSPPATSMVSSRSVSGHGGAVEFVRVAVEALEVEVGDVGAEVREPPGDALVVADDHAGEPRERVAADVEPAVVAQLGAVQAHLRPDRRHRGAEVRVVREQREARLGERAREHPRVRSEVAALGAEQLGDAVEEGAQRRQRRGDGRGGRRRRMPQASASVAAIGSTPVAAGGGRGHPAHDRGHRVPREGGMQAGDLLGRAAPRRAAPGRSRRRGSTGGPRPWPSATRSSRPASTARGCSPGSAGRARRTRARGLRRRAVRGRRSRLRRRRRSTRARPDRAVRTPARRCRASRACG